MTFTFVGFIRGTCVGIVDADSKEEAIKLLKSGNYVDIIDVEYELDGIDETTVKEEEV